MADSPKSDAARGVSTPVPPRKGAKSRPAGGAARPTRGTQARQAQHRRNRILAWTAVAGVVVIVAALVGIKLAGSGSSGGAPRQPAPAAAVAKLTSVPLSTLTAAAAKINGLQAAQPAGDPPLTSGGKPNLLYIGAEFCPICATERWPMTIALSHFGTFSNLSQTHSAVRDGNIATLSFYGSSFSSPYLSFSPVETTTNQPSGNYYKTLETPTAAQQAIWQKHEGTNLAFPFIDIGGKWLLETSQYPDTILQGKTFSDILNAVGSNDNTLGAAIDASAAVLTRYICDITGNKPAQTCQAVASLPLPSTSGSGTSSPAG